MLTCREDGPGTITLRRWDTPECNGQERDASCFRSGGCFPDTTSPTSRLYKGCAEGDTVPWVRLFFFPASPNCGKTDAAHYGVNLPAKPGHINLLHLPSFSGSGSAFNLSVTYNGPTPVRGGLTKHKFVFIGGGDGEDHFKVSPDLVNNHAKGATDCVPLGAWGTACVVDAGVRAIVEEEACTYGNLDSRPCLTTHPPGAGGNGGGFGGSKAAAVAVGVGAVLLLLFAGAAGSRVQGRG
jgi:hypothetical protein